MPLREVRVTPPSTMSCRALSACLSLRPSNAASMAAQRGPMPRTQLVADRKTRWQRRHLVACSVVLLMSELYITSTCTCKPHVIVGCMDEQQPHVIVGCMDEQPIAEARANLSEIAAQVRLLRKAVMLTRRGNKQVAIVPAELAEAAAAGGG